MRRPLLALAGIAALAGLAYAYGRGGAPAPSAARAPDPVPVLLAESERRDVPVYLDTIGTVQAYNTVAVKVMVDGPLVEVRFREGQDVHAGDVLARIDPRPYQATLDQYAAKKAQDEAQLANARVDLVRYQKLAATAYTSAQTADTQRAVVAQDEALVRQDQAQIDSARTQLGYTTIVAPIDGRTGIRQVDQGNIVHATDTTPLTVIAQLQPISVVFTLPQQTLPAVSASLARGAPPVLALAQGGPASTDEAETLDRGEVAVLDNQVDAATGTIKLKATFPNTALRLWPGGFVSVRLLVDTRPRAVTVPPAAVQRGPRGSYLYVVGDDRRAHWRDVAIGYQDGRNAVVTAGLEGGEQVVTDGASRLADGTPVIVEGAQSSPAAEAATSRRGRPGSS